MKRGDIMEYKKIKEYFVGKNLGDNELVKFKRCFGYYEIPKYDPYLYLDYFDSKNPEDYMKGFPWHPHRGLETITYMIDGVMNHEDSLGNKGRIGPGALQWMRAGSGVLHTELPEEGEYFRGLQLWLNLKKEDKMKEPEYREIKADEVAVYQDEEKTVKIIAGEYKGKKGPIDLSYGSPVYLDVELKPNSKFTFVLGEGYNAFAFVIDGQVNFNYRSDRFIENAMGVLFEKEGDRIKANTKKEGGRFVLIGGIPYEEPIAWGGSIVMNTKEEITQAMKEYRNGTLVKNQSDFIKEKK